MNQMELTASMREVLAALVEEYRRTEETVTADTIASAVGLGAGSVRNRMQGLKALNLVEGIPGPNGGYLPTAEAYRALDREDADEAEPVTLAREFERVTATVEAIDFVDVHDPEHCRARLTVAESDREFDVGDAIAIGPTPGSGLLLAGVVESVDDGVLVDVAQLETVADE